MVSVIIINYNTFQLTCDCIRSVQGATKDVAYEIVLVDNASTKENPDDFLVQFPDIKLVKNPVNGGFAQGNNLGIKHATGDIILLLNSDTILHDDSISKAASFLQSCSRDIGVVSGHLTYADGKYQHNARAFRSIRNEVLDLLRPLLMLIPYRGRATLMLNQYFKGDFDTYCDWVSGAFFMFRKEILNDLPERKLDERFFMYGEDQLWCYQFRQEGYRCYFLSDTKLIHIANASTEPAKQLKLLKTMINHELEIIRYRKGASLYYYLFSMIFVAKERGRYYIKLIVQKMFNYRIR